MPDPISFEELANLSDREAQVLMRECDQQDLATALKEGGQRVTSKFLSNMSQRARSMVEAEIEAAEATAEKVEETRQRIVQQVMKLAEQGQIDLSNPRGSASKGRRKLGKKYLDSKRELGKLTQRSFQQLSYEEIDRLFTGFAEIARQEGILALEKVIRGSDEDFLNYGLRLAVDGTEPDLIMDILETWRDSLLHQHKTKYDKVIEGIMSIQSGDNPRIIESKLKRLF